MECLWQGLHSLLGTLERDMILWLPFFSVSSSLAASLDAHLSCLVDDFLWVFLERPSLLKCNIYHGECLFFQRARRGS